MPSITLPVVNVTPGPTWATQVNAAFTAVNGQVDTNTAAITALPTKYPAYRLWTGSAYPARLSGHTNIFFGPVDPGLAMTSADFWANSNVTTLTEIIGELADDTSDLAEAVVRAANPRFTYSAAQLAKEPGAAFVQDMLGSSPDSHLVWVMPNTGVHRLFLQFVTPEGWTAAKVSAWYYSTAAPSGNVCWTINFTRLNVASDLVGGDAQTFTQASGTASRVVVATTPDAVTVIPGGLNNIMVARNASSASDTFEQTINLLSVVVERSA